MRIPDTETTDTRRHARTAPTPGFATMTAKTDTIDWKEVRRRIAETPLIVPSGPTPEATERRRSRARDRWRKHYYANLEHCHERQKDWEAANPDKVKAKRHRCYEKMKQDPERLERKRRRNREYKARKRLEKLTAQAA